jgi:hypothetical protein
LRVHEWLSKPGRRNLVRNLGVETCCRNLGYRKTTTATRTPRIRTTMANRLTWFAHHGSFTGAESARKAGTNSFGAAAVGAAPESGDSRGSSWLPSGSGCFVSKFFFSLSLSFFSQSRQSVLPSETGNPQEAHFCTRSIASGTEAAGGLTAASTGRPVSSATSELEAVLILAPTLGGASSGISGGI